MKDTSECVGCKYGKLVKTKEKPHYYIKCKYKDKTYSYGQRLECVNYEKN